MNKPFKHSVLIDHSVGSMQRVIVWDHHNEGRNMRDVKTIAVIAEFDPTESDEFMLRTIKQQCVGFFDAVAFNDAWSKRTSYNDSDGSGWRVNRRTQ